MRRRTPLPFHLVVSVALAMLLGSCSADGRPGGPGVVSAPSELRVDVQESTVEPQLAVQLEAALAEAMRCFEVPGAAILVDTGEHDRGRWVATAGVADIESGAPVSTDMQWPIRSITKSFTVAILLQLAQEGLLSLDDTLDNWVDGIPSGDEMTLRQLADMTSGVPDYTGEAFVEDFTADPTAAFDREQLIDYVRVGTPSAQPGEERRYINSSTVLLGEVIEQVTGEGFEDMLERRLTAPLELERTFYPTDVEGFSAPHPTGYQPDGDGLVVPPTNFTVFDTAGAMISTLEDLERWGQVLARGRTADPADERIAGPLAEGPEYDTYGVGIGEIDNWWGHTGEGFGYTTLVMHDPRTSATAVILMNVSNAAEHPPTKLFRHVAGILEGSDPSNPCGTE